MPFLSEADHDQLRAIFTQQLRDPVRLRLFTKPATRLFIPGVEPCLSCAEAEPLLRELEGLSDTFELVVHDVSTEPAAAIDYGVAETLPAIVLEPADGTPVGAVRFLGLPAGYEFSTLVADIVDLSNRRVDLSAGTQQELRELEQDLHLQVFVTPT